MIGYSHNYYLADPTAFPDETGCTRILEEILKDLSSTNRALSEYNIDVLAECRYGRAVADQVMWSSLTSHGKIKSC
jgi:hypothetical protein